MLTVERGVVINRPIEHVFTFVANFENEPQYNPSIQNMRKTSLGAIGLGTTQAEKRSDWLVPMTERQRSMSHITPSSTK